MQQCVREALKRRRYWRTPELPGPGKFRSNRDAVTARTVYAQVLYQIGALAAIVRPGGELRHVKPHGMLCNQAAKSRLGRRYRPCGARCRRRPGAGWAGGQRAYPRRTALSVDDAPEVFADRGYQADGSPVPRSQPGALIERRAGAGANAGNGAAQSGAQPERRMGACEGGNGLSAWRWRSCARFRQTLARRVCRAQYRRQRGPQ